MRHKKKLKKRVFIAVSFNNRDEHIAFEKIIKISLENGFSKGDLVKEAVNYYYFYRLNGFIDGKNISIGHK